MILITGTIGSRNIDRCIFIFLKHDSTFEQMLQTKFLYVFCFIVYRQTELFVIVNSNYTILQL